MKKNKGLFYILAAISSICIICLVAVVAINMSSTGTKASNYVKEFGGNPNVYDQIISLNDCTMLQEQFDQADENLQLHQPGTAQYQWSIGYMKAADDRMKEIGCSK